jgi:tetratricopeptide (TPR) repeat protein
MPEVAEEAATPAAVTAQNEKDPVVKKDPVTAIDSNALYLLLVGETALQRQHYDVALEAYLEAARRVSDPRVAEKAAKIGQYLENLPKTEKAVSLWLSKDEKNMNARQLGLSAALSKKNQPELIKHLSAILKNNPAAFEDTLLAIEKVLKTEADLKFVYGALEVLAKKNPQQAVIFLTQSILAIRQNNLSLAKQKIHQAVVLQPNWEKAINFEQELLMYSGKIAFKNKRFSEAIAWFDKVKRMPMAFEAGIAAVSILYEQKKFPEALTRLEALLSKTQEPKQRVQVLVMQAELFNLQKDYQRAVALLSRALEQEPDQRELLYTRALTAEKLGDVAAMEADLQKIIDKNPEDATALNALGYSLTEKTTRYEEAEIYLAKALKLQPDEAVIIDSYGWLQFKKGNLPGALKYLQAAFKKLPENEIAAHLSEVLWVLGSKKEALAVFNGALKKSPTDEMLLEFQERVLNKQGKD